MEKYTGVAELWERYLGRLCAIMMTLLASGCGNVSNGGAGRPVDAMRDTPIGRCNLGATFSAPELLANVNGAADEWGAQLSPDEKSIYFASTRDGAPHLYVAERHDPEGDFGPARWMIELDLGQSAVY